MQFFLGDEEPAAAAAKAPVPVDDAPLADKLDYAAARGLDKITEVLRVALPDADAPAFGNVSRVQVAAANTAINARLRVDEAGLRARTTDVLPRLLEILAHEELKLAARGVPNMPLHDEKAAECK